MIQLASPQPVTKHQTYIYQRNGVYYFRLRIRKARIIDRMTSVSLRTKDRRTAMATARHIKSALKAIHADNPDASYEELREHLRDIAEGELSTGRSDLFEPHMWGIYHEQYNELGQNLTDAVASEPLTDIQHRYINEAFGVLKACMKRLEGNSRPLLEYLDSFDDNNGTNTNDNESPNKNVSLLLSVEPKVITFLSLVEQYEKENAQNWKPTTLSENRSVHLTLIEIFNYLGLNDVSKATRADMLKVREVLQKLPKNRKQRFKNISLSELLAREDQSDGLDVVTINNKYLIKMAAIFKWALKNDLIEKNLTEGLELRVPSRKASDARKAFSQEQVAKLLNASKAYSLKHLGKPYHYYVPILAAITGARLNEIAQLQVKDIRVTEAGTTYIHINEDGSNLTGKSIKNAHSDRCVPLVDGAYGFVLADFMKLVADRRDTMGDTAMVFDGLRLMKNGYGEQISKWFNRTLLPKVIVDREGLAFHSLRHSMATLMKQHGVELAYAQAIMGHSSGSITYDRYAKDVEVDTLAKIIKEVFLLKSK